MLERIPLSGPHFGKHELQFVEEALKSNLGTPQVRKFEEEFATYNGLDHVTGLSSGTAAIHLSLILLGVKPGDTVLCQSHTFSASANPICYLGAKPVFIDSEPDTWNMDPNLLAGAIAELLANGQKPAAIIPVHLYGMPAKMKEILEIAKEYDIPVIEDAAEAIGSSIAHQKCGTFGDLVIYSFNINKVITTGGGGMIAGKNKEWIHKARYLASQARETAPHYQHSEVGYNYQMNPISAAVGRGQLEVLDDRISARRKVFDWYRELMGLIEGVTFLEEPEGTFSNRWLTTILIDPKLAGFSREELRLAFEADNIEARPLWKPMHLQPVFKDCKAYVNGVSEKLFEQGLCLPSSSNITGEHFARIEKVIKRFL